MSQDNAVSAATMLERTVGLRLSHFSPGNSKKVPLSKVEVDADKKRLRMTKRLVDCKEYEAIMAYDRETQGWIRNQSVPSPFGRSIYLQPKQTVSDADSYLESRAAGRESLIEAYLAIYGQAVEQAQSELRSVFSQLDYPSVAETRMQFGMVWQWITFGTPTDLPDDVRLKERDKAAAIYHEAAEEARSLLREFMVKHVEWMIARLTPDEKGKTRKVQGPALQKVQDFLAGFDIRNVTDDAELAKLIAQARSLLKGVSSDRLQASGVLRAQIKTGFEQIKKVMEPMMVEQPSRKIVLSHNEDSE